MNNPTTPQEKKITLPLRIFLKYFWGYLDKRLIEEQEIAELVAAIDADESFCHVQLEDFDGGDLEHPIIWQIKDWKSCYLKWKMDKERQAKERHEACLLSENTERIAKAMAKTAGMNFNDPDVHETFMTMARRVAKTKDQKKAALWDTKLDLD